MNYFKIFLLILLGTHTISAQEYQSKPELEKEIVGTWHYENEPKSKIVFYDNGTLKRYFEKELQSVSSYEITSNCDGEVLPENQFFLQETDKNDSFCSYIEAINFNKNGIFSLMTKSQGRIIVLKRSE
jgi:hypothetical protein